ncbi:ATP-NAD kinase-like domain-containing protein [Mycena belliarum]|uniref:ATP-NAD kinase-like domain-containing protein n=1 Tax=Mycena belliarum TaxID=1033014 RepID=A0AAD6UDS3_9AGAR|nr:ATP-NAD kinase-like domain-containing protein [Mycena belliae]
MSRKKGTGPMSLTNLSGVAEGADGDILDAWIETLLHFAYEGAGVKRGRRLKVVINPHGGTKKGAAVFKKTVEPIFRSAQCSLDVIHTTRGGHAYDIARTMALDYDAIVAVSGDGLIHEILNGFAHHEQPVKAFRIPLAPVPTGTGNALSLNLLGMEDGFDVSAAALNVVKGLPMNVDVFSLTQNGKRTISFMTQATGLLADLDIGTEHLRWMGEARFMYGLLRGVLQFKKCPVQLSYKAVELDKDRMFDNLQAQRFKAGNKNRAVPSSPPIPENEGNALPPLKYRPTDDDGWTILDDTFVYVFAGKGPYVGRDMMAFPVSLPDDGLIDILAQSASSRSDVLLSLGGAPKGEFYWNSSIHYIKANAYRIKPLAPKGSLAVDGEIFPFEEFQVEAHQGLATLLSPYGRYAAEFAPRPKRKATS